MRGSKPIEFLGSSLDDLRAFPLRARRELGHQTSQVQHGQEPDDWTPMTLGQGAKEVRTCDTNGRFWVIHLAKFADAVYALHCFGQEAKQTSQAELDLAAKRYGNLLKNSASAMNRQRFASVWDAIEESAEGAQQLKLRSILLMALNNYRVRAGLTPQQTIDRFGVSPQLTSDFTRGNINRFDLEELVNMAAVAGLQIEMQVLDTP